jgi:hypothetical protein
MTFSAADLTGYDVAHYAITGGKDGTVRLRFISAEITKDGKTVHEANAPTLPFTLPRGTGHIRLVYVVRVSQADHNMALLASKHLETLNTFTAQLRRAPGICKCDGEFFSLGSGGRCSQAGADIDSGSVKRLTPRYCSLGNSGNLDSEAARRPFRAPGRLLLQGSFYEVSLALVGVASLA